MDLADSMIVFAELYAGIDTEMCRACALGDTIRLQHMGDFQRCSKGEETQNATLDTTTAGEDYGDGYSKDEHETTRGEFRSFTFGTPSIFAVFRLIKKHCSADSLQGATFVDIGSGAGHVVFGALLMLPGIAKSVGVELLPSLHSLASKRQTHYMECRNAALPDSAWACAPSPELVELRNTDLRTDPWWKEAHIVMAVSTCFTEQLMVDLEALALMMEPGTMVITLRHQLKDKRWELLETCTQIASWGKTQFYVHKLSAA